MVISKEKTFLQTIVSGFWWIKGEEIGKRKKSRNTVYERKLKYKNTEIQKLRKVEIQFEKQSENRHFDRPEGKMRLESERKYKNTEIQMRKAEIQFEKQGEGRQSEARGGGRRRLPADQSICQFMHSIQKLKIAPWHQLMQFLSVYSSFWQFKSQK